MYLMMTMKKSRKREEIDKNNMNTYKEKVYITF